MLEPKDEGLVALCALLLEMAHIDGDFSEPEAILLIDLLSHELAQSIVRGEALLHRAQGRLRLAPDLETLAAGVKRHFDPDERAAILGLLWQVAWADGRLDKFEAYMMRRLGVLLGVPEERVREEQRFAIERMEAERGEP